MDFYQTSKKRVDKRVDIGFARFTFSTVARAATLERSNFTHSPILAKLVFYRVGQSLTGQIEVQTIAYQVGRFFAIAIGGLNSLARRSLFA